MACALACTSACALACLGPACLGLTWFALVCFGLPWPGLAQKPWYTGHQVSRREDSCWNLARLKPWEGVCSPLGFFPALCHRFAKRENPESGPDQIGPSWPRKKNTKEKTGSYLPHPFSEKTNQHATACGFGKSLASWESSEIGTFERSVRQRSTVCKYGTRTCGDANRGSKSLCRAWRT